MYGQGRELVSVGKLICEQLTHQPRINNSRFDNSPDLEPLYLTLSF
jgi:hypothetical protein